MISIVMCMVIARWYTLRTDANCWVILRNDESILTRADNFPISAKIATLFAASVCSVITEACRNTILQQNNKRTAFILIYWMWWTCQMIASCQRIRRKFGNCVTQKSPFESCSVRNALFKLAKRDHFQGPSESLRLQQSIGTEMARNIWIEVLIESYDKRLLSFLDASRLTTELTCEVEWRERMTHLCRSSYLLVERIQLCIRIWTSRDPRRRICVHIHHCSHHKGQSLWNTRLREQVRNITFRIRMWVWHFNQEMNFRSISDLCSSCHR